MSRLFPLGIRGFRSPTPKRLAAMLAGDQQRARPRVTLPGSPTASSPPSPADSPPAVDNVRTRQLPPTSHNGRINSREPREAQPEDAIGPYPQVELLKMDAAFSDRLERALVSGRETHAGMIGRCKL